MDFVLLAAEVFFMQFVAIETQNSLYYPITNVRLANNVSSANGVCGRVEVLLYNVWGTVCDDSWSDLDAFVVCRFLGYSGGTAYKEAVYGQGTGPIHLKDVTCTGFEASLNYCPFTSDTISLPIYCTHAEDAGVCCNATGQGPMYPITTTPPPPQNYTDICPWLVTKCLPKLVGRRYNGLYYDRTRPHCPSPVHTVQHVLAFVDRIKTNVVCGFRREFLSPNDWNKINTYFVYPVGEALVGNWKMEMENNCGPIRPIPLPVNVMLYGITPGIGYVMLQAPNGTWGFVCDDYFDMNAAKVVCYELCYDTVLVQPKPGMTAHYRVTPPAIVIFSLDDVQCTGSEDTLRNCAHRPYFENDCQRNEIASVTCVNQPEFDCPECPTKPPELQCRDNDMIVLFNLTLNPNLEVKHISFLNKTSTCNPVGFSSQGLLTFKFRYDECGTNLTENATHIIHTNTLLIMYTSQYADITRVPEYRVEVMCALPRNLTASNYFGIRTDVVTQSSVTNFTAVIYFCEDSTFTRNVTAVPYLVKIGCWLNVTVELTSTDTRLKMVVTDCRAKPNSTNPRVPIYPLIQNKCIVDSTLTTFQLGTKKFGFVYQPFMFIGYQEVVIECDIHVCLVSDGTADCDQSCNSTKSNGRRRRSSSLITQSDYTITSTPFIFITDDQLASPSNALPFMQTSTRAFTTTTSSLTRTSPTSSNTSQLVAAFPLKQQAYNIITSTPSTTTTLKPTAVSTRPTTASSMTSRPGAASTKLTTTSPKLAPTFWTTAKTLSKAPILLVGELVKDVRGSDSNNGFNQPDTQSLTADSKASGVVTSFVLILVSINVSVYI